ncbi:MAG: methyltransferase domain-containing protein [Bacilli bacterium]|nr:methyltransferase domain-containing protein [Bacilli bacterium]
MEKWNLNKLKKQANGNQASDEEILKLSNILKYKNLKVLDVGCSNGYKTNLLFNKYKNISHIIGIDNDEFAIKSANLDFINDKRYHFVNCDINAFNSNYKFDIIYLSYVLQHLENPISVLKRLRTLLSDKGVIIVKVPDDSFKVCYPDDENLLERIFNLYENNVLKASELTKFTDRYIGKKTYNFLKVAGFSNITLKHIITDTIGKNKEEKIDLFNTSIAFRSAANRNNVDENIKKELEYLLNKLKLKFEDENFYYSMTVLYFIVKK